MSIDVKWDFRVIGAAVLGGAILSVVLAFGMRGFAEFYRKNHCYSALDFVLGYGALEDIRGRANFTGSVSRFYDSCMPNPEVENALSEILSEKSSSLELFEVTKNADLEKVALATVMDRFLRDGQIAIINDDQTMELLADVFYKSSKKSRIVELLGGDSYRDKESSPLYWLISYVGRDVDVMEHDELIDALTRLAAISDFIEFDTSTINSLRTRLEKINSDLREVDGKLEAFGDISRKVFHVGRGYEQLVYNSDMDAYLKKHEAYIGSVFSIVLTNGVNVIDGPGTWALEVRQIDTFPYEDDWGYSKVAPVFLVVGRDEIALRKELKDKGAELLAQKATLKNDVAMAVEAMKAEYKSIITDSDRRCVLDEVSTRSAYHAVYLKSNGVPDGKILDKVKASVIKEDAGYSSNIDGYMDSIELGVYSGLEHPENYSDYNWNAIQESLQRCLSESLNGDS